MNQKPNIEEWKKLAKEILAPNVTYIDPKFKEVASWAEELLNAFWVEQQKDLDAFIDTLHQQLQKAREEEREKALNAVSGWMDDAEWHEIKDRVFEALNNSELDQDKK